MKVERFAKKTLANLSHWPMHKIDALRRVLRDEPLITSGEAFRIERSLPHGGLSKPFGRDDPQHRAGSTHQ